ncbi:MAG: hypothetical protein JO304_16065 [Solirubrobacterales bacterium]|nr:hypothetical protein [Solirubrobacterales bacterium]
MPRGSNIGGVNILGMVYLLLVLAAVFLPILLGRLSPPPGQSDSDSDDGGGGGGPGQPPAPPNTPGGGIPLDDAEPARSRLRGHDRLSDGIPARARRPSREPVRRRDRTHQRASG